MSALRTGLLGWTANATRTRDTGNAIKRSYGNSGLDARNASIARSSELEIAANSACPARSRKSPMSERMPTIFSDWPDSASMIAWFGVSSVALKVEEP